MEKLIEILNKYQEEKNSEIRFKRIDDSDFFVCWDDVWLGYETILSKKFWFIKWLVENDKIDTQNLITYMNWTSLTFNKVPSTDCTNIDKIWNNFYTECLLMLLSIQDNPIEFLISILK